MKWAEVKAKLAAETARADEAERKLAEVQGGKPPPNSIKTQCQRCGAQGVTFEHECG